jgi:hypothetical protein
VLKPMERISDNEGFAALDRCVVLFDVGAVCSFFLSNNLAYMHDGDGFFRIGPFQDWLDRERSKGLFPELLDVDSRGWLADLPRGGPADRRTESCHEHQEESA